MSLAAADDPGTRGPKGGGLPLRPPVPDDAAAMWRMARANGLDANSPYYYLAFCRDFAGTSIVATRRDQPVGFVTGYRRPAQPGTLFVWQVAVDHGARRQGVGLAMLSALAGRLASSGVDHVEATVTTSNGASSALFRALARVAGAPVAEATLFTAAQFPAGSGHEPEILVRIGPLAAAAGARPMTERRRRP
ncbi:MAG: diaminobutyrate acetyltransferase [Acidimicrobiales bacterium]